MRLHDYENKNITYVISCSLFISKERTHIFFICPVHSCMPHGSEKFFFVCILWGYVTDSCDSSLLIESEERSSCLALCEYCERRLGLEKEQSIIPPPPFPLPWKWKFRLKMKVPKINFGHPLPRKQKQIGSFLGDSYTSACTLYNYPLN